MARPGTRQPPAPRTTPTQAFVPEVGAVPFPGYRLHRLRGIGGFSTVWEASDETGELIALKFMSSANPSTTARELRSLQAIQTVTHQNLLYTRDVWSVPGWIVIAMDLADASMLDLLELYTEEFGRTIEVEKLCHYLYQAALALDFLNRRHHRIDGKLVGLQHGDIKPNNILLHGEQAKLADYGLATPMAGPSTPCPRHGTAEYCAPEVFQGILSDRSDQFGLAVTYFVLRTARFPYPQPPTNRESLKNYVRPEADLSPLSPTERPAMLRALSPIPQNRYPSCLDFMTAILQCQGLRAQRDEGGSSKIGQLSELIEAPKSRLFK